MGEGLDGIVTLGLVAQNNTYKVSVYASTERADFLRSTYAYFDQAEGARVRRVDDWVSDLYAEFSIRAGRSLWKISEKAQKALFQGGDHVGKITVLPQIYDSHKTWWANVLRLQDQLKKINGEGRMLEEFEGLYARLDDRLVQAVRSKDPQRIQDNWSLRRMMIPSSPNNDFEMQEFIKVCDWQGLQHHLLEGEEETLRHPEASDVEPDNPFVNILLRLS
jgi:hypothetical protein